MINYYKEEKNNKIYYFMYKNNNKIKIKKKTYYDNLNLFMINPNNIIPIINNKTFNINKCDMYYINLERSKDRRFYIEKEFKRHNLKVKRLL